MIFDWTFNVHLEDLYDIELTKSNHLLILTGGHVVELPLDETLSKSLVSLWEQIGIENIEP